MTRNNDVKYNKRVGIITFHRANNYGAVLQAYALCEYLNSNEKIECKIINYISDYMESQYKPFIISTKSIKAFVLSVLYCPIRIMRGKKYAQFRKQYYRLSETVYSKNNIERANDEFDCFVFGSDQIWNDDLNGEDEIFYGNFVENGKDKISYAASFGERIIDNKKFARYVDDLKNFKSVSLREKSGSEIYYELTGKDAKEVMDPVFLLEKEQWNRLCKEKKSNYILVYHLQGNRTEVDKYARELSEKTGLPIVETQVWIKPKHKKTKHKHADSPNEFLTWIKNAKYIVTDSFHCSAFSVIFEKNFWACLPRNKNIEESRVGNLLLNLGLENRKIDSVFDMQNWNYDMLPDYNLVDNKKKVLIQDSKDFLKKSLDI